MNFKTFHLKYICPVGCYGPDGSDGLHDPDADVGICSISAFASFWSLLHSRVVLNLILLFAISSKFVVELQNHQENVSFSKSSLLRVVLGPTFLQCKIQWP